MKLPSLKHRHPIVYISLTIYVLLLGLITYEACLPSGLSGLRSDIIAMISSWFINTVTEPEIPNPVDPISVDTVNEVSYQGNGNVTIGTTSLISVPFKYPKKTSKYDVYNQKYSLEYLSGSKDDYSVTLASRNVNATNFTVDMRITPNKMTDDLYQIKVSIADLSYTYSFHIVDLGTPVTFDAKVLKDNLKIGETTQIVTKLKDNKNNPDIYIRRFLDETKISRSSTNENVATIDKYGVIHALNAGTTTINYGDKTFPITVNNEHIDIPSTNNLTIKVSDNANEYPSLRDYDYIFDSKYDINKYTTLIYAEYDNPDIEDKTVSWEIDNNLKARLVPYAYDSDGYPTYMDEDGLPCIRIAGYRSKGDINISCISNIDNNVNDNKVLTVDEAIPEEMTINIGKTDLLVNEQKVITVKEFDPVNVNNTKIHIDVDKPEMVTINNNDSSSVMITGTQIGSVTITVKSLANPSLTKQFTLNFAAKETINDDNYADFAQLMRKVAGHFFLFLLTAVFGTIFFVTYFSEDKKISMWLAALISIGFGYFFAFLSELIQVFVNGRSGSVQDIGIDTLGYIIGSLLVVLIILLIRFIKSKKKPKITEDNKE